MKHPVNVAARNSENCAAEYFRNMGFTVSISNGRGPDLILKLGEAEMTCEVKMLGRHKYYSDPVYRSTPVKPKRVNDDLICFVLGESVFSVEEMKTHFSHCPPGGFRLFKFPRGAPSPH
jgi:hypothetical protein